MNPVHPRRFNGGMATVASPRRVRALRRKRRAFWLRRLRLCPKCEERLRAPTRIVSDDTTRFLGSEKVRK